MKIGAYDVIRVLGKGGMSEVYEAENPRLGSRHALKVYTYRNDDPDVRRRFDVVGRLLARPGHPRIVKVTDIDQQGRINLSRRDAILALEARKAQQEQG